jgi:clan AA aspartic protease (TIGR02281 family)
MRRFFLRSGLPTLLACLGLAAPATSEVYQWVDENGSISFSDRLHRVPQAARSTLVRRSSEPETAFLAATGGTDRDRPNSRNGVFVVPFERMDALIQVSVRLNEEVTAPFYVDTAASSVVIPAALAARLDLDPDSAAKIRYARTANGRVPMSAARLTSVDLQGAAVEDVSCLISDQLEVGLLGASYLRHFKYTVDNAAQTLVLEPLAHAGGTAALAPTH